MTDKKIINIVENVLIDFNDDIVNSLNQKDLKLFQFIQKKNNIIEVVPESEELGFVGIPSKIKNSF